MSAVSYLRRHPKAALPVLASLLIASGAAAASSASFTASAQENAALAANQISLGSSGTLAFSSLIPAGTAYNKTFTVTNDGDRTAVALVPGTLASPAGPRGGALKNAVTLTITDTSTSTVVFAANSFSSLPASIDLGTWAKNSTHTFRFDVMFPDSGTPTSANSGDNAYQGTSLTQPFTWQAVAS